MTSVANIRCDYMQWKEIATTSHFILFYFHFPFPFSTLQLVKPDAVKCMSAPSPITISLRHPAHCTVDGDNHRFVFHSSALSIPLFLLCCIPVYFEWSWDKHLISSLLLPLSPPWLSAHAPIFTSDLITSCCFHLHLDLSHLFSPEIW